MLLKAIEYFKRENNLEGDFRGIVVKNDDPEKLCRIKVKIPKILESDDIEKLPWCYPQGISSLGGRPDLSNTIIPEVNSLITVYFPNKDNVYFPVYKGFFKNSNTKQDIFDEDYPESYGFVDSTVSFYRVNKKEQYAEYYHVSGLVIRIDKEGNLVIVHPKSLTHDIGEDYNLNIAKNFNIQVGENYNLKCTNYSRDVSANDNINVGAIYSLSAGANVNINASANLSCMGANIFFVSAGNLAEQVGGAHFIKCSVQGILSSGLIAHMGTLIAHNQAPPTPIPAVPPTPPDMSNLESGIADLESEISNLTSKLNELKTLAENLKSRGEEVKAKLESEANSLKGDS